MAFIYEIKINQEPINNIELGFTHIRDLEEALDSGSISILLKQEKPLNMYSVLEIKVDEVDDWEEENVLDTKEILMLVVSDKVEPISKELEYFKHEITFIEYTSKFDTYLMNNLSFTNRSLDKKLAKFQIDDIGISDEGSNGLYFSRHLYLEPLEKVYANYLEDEPIIFKQKDIAKYYDIKINGDYDEYSFDVYLEVGSLSYKISEQDVELTLPIGKYELKYIIDIDEEELDLPIMGKRTIYKYYIEILPKETNTMYDLIRQVRNTVSKYGGIESKVFFDTTRLFNIKDEHIEFLKSIEAPQVFLEVATVRQILIFVLSYINALPRVYRDFKNGIDILDLEFYGERIDDFILEDILSITSSQDNAQIGTRSYSALKNILPNDLNEPTTFAPSQDGYYTVRAENIQMNDTDFELKLPKGKKLYKPIKFGVNVIIRKYHKTLNNNDIEITDEEVFLDFTELLINKSEWELKDKSSNFPNVFYSKLYDDEFGLDMYQTENFYWQQGDTSIKLSDVNGQIFKSNLLASVLQYGFRKHFALERPYDFVRDFSNPDYDVRTYYKINVLETFGVENVFGDNPALAFRQLKFYIEYITSEELNIKQDKEDLSQINFYSEMRQNQEENTISLSRVSNKTYGNLQRTSNKEFSFMKVHKSFNDMYEVGQVDNEDYVITRVISEYYNEYIVNTYYVTKDHNRISQATFIDQTYRKFDNYAQQITNRHETYNDYVMLVEPNDDMAYYHTDTKIFENLLPENEILFDKILFGVLGVNHNILETKATTALVRTDGFLEEYLDDFIEDEFNMHFISTPITSAGFRQGLVFKFGFDDNQIAGDRLVSRGEGVGLKYFNEAVRYTDNRGRFTYLDFYIYNKLTEFDYDNYPLTVVDGEKISNFKDLSDGIIPYFATGYGLFNDTSSDSLVVHKDTMTNFNLSYSLNIMSYNYGKYIFGEKFYKYNHLVYNKDIEEKTYLYFYEDTIYNIFENLKIKEGWIGDRIENNHVSIISGGYIYNSHPYASNHTWAIGDENGNLIFVNNDGGNYIKIMKTHIRPNVDEIAGKNVLKLLKIVPVNTKLSLIENIENEYIQEDNIYGNYELSNKVEKILTFNTNVKTNIDYNSYDLLEYIYYDEVISEIELNSEVENVYVEFRDISSHIDFNLISLDDEYIGYNETSGMVELKGVVEEIFTSITNLNTNISFLEYVLDEYIGFKQEPINKVMLNSDVFNEPEYNIGVYGNITYDSKLTNDYILEDNVYERRLLDVDFGVGNINKMELTSSLGVSQSHTSEYINYDTQDLTSVINAEDYDFGFYIKNNLSNQINYNNTLLDEYISFNQVNEELSISNAIKLGKFDIRDLETDIEFFGSTSQEYIYIDTINKVISIKNDLSIRKEISQNLSSNININKNLLDTYINFDDVNYIKEFELNYKTKIDIEKSLYTNISNYESILDEYIGFNTINDLAITSTNILGSIAQTLEEPQLLSSITNICQQVTLKIKNNNNISVDMYIDNVSYGSINANSSKTVVVPHTLNGGSGGGGGFFRPVIRFEKNSKNSSKTLKILVMSVCIMP